MNQGMGTQSAANSDQPPSGQPAHDSRSASGQ